MDPPISLYEATIALTLPIIDCTRKSSVSSSSKEVCAALQLLIGISKWVFSDNYNVQITHLAM
jgi:hypothetical protein